MLMTTVSHAGDVGIWTVQFCDPAHNRVGGGLTVPVLPHHRAYGSVHGGFVYGCNAAYLLEKLLRPWVLNQVLLIAW